MYKQPTDQEKAINDYLISLGRNATWTASDKEKFDQLLASGVHMATTIMGAARNNGYDV